MTARVTLTIAAAAALVACGGKDEKSSPAETAPDVMRAPTAAPAPAEGDAPLPPEIVRADLPGRTIFDRQCAPCHGAGPGDDGAPMLPGTMALAKKYDGALPAQLELRSDLNAASIALFVRSGSGAMPSFRKAELTDADIAAIAAYLTKTAALSGYPREE